MIQRERPQTIAISPTTMMTGFASATTACASFWLFQVEGSPSIWKRYQTGRSISGQLHHMLA